MSRQAASLPRFVIEQGLTELCGWIPTPIGIAVRSAVYRSILHMKGVAAIEKSVRIRFASNVTLDSGVYLDERVYLHACPNGIHIANNTLVMHGSVLHVYNFRGIPHSGIWIGRDSLIGEYNVIRGQGGVHIGSRVYTSPMVQLLAVNHVYHDVSRPFVEQGITAEGITIEDDVWIGSGAIVTDGVTVGKGAVIAAGSVVTRDIEPHTLVAGSPARAIRKIDGTGTGCHRAKPYFEEELNGRNVTGMLSR